MKTIIIQVITLNTYKVIGFMTRKFVDGLYNGVKRRCKKTLKKDKKLYPSLYSNANYLLKKIEKPYYGFKLIVTGPKELIEKEEQDWLNQWEKVEKSKILSAGMGKVTQAGINYSYKIPSK